jgi:hypothetical protein
VVDEFFQEVQSVVGPFLSGLGFAMDEVDSAVDEGGPKASIIYYRGKDCKIQVFHSGREGGINAMIAPLDALNEYGLYNRSGKWHFFNDFTKEPGLPLEELLRRMREDEDAGNFETTTKWLEWLKRERIARYFDSAHAAIVEGRGN